MDNNKQELKLNVFNLIRECLKEVAHKNDVEWNHSFLKWNSNFRSYDFSTSLLIVISFNLKKTEQQVFFEIKDSLENVLNYVDIVKSENNYLNFTFRQSFYKEFLNSFVDNPFPFCYEKKDRINVEFVSVNPTGYLHLGHLRNALIGDAIANIYKFIGFKVFKEYYVNDRGQQIENLVNSVIFHLKNVWKIPVDSYLDENHQQSFYCGKSIEEVSHYLIKEKNFSIRDIKLENVFFRSSIIEFFISSIKSDLRIFGVYFDKWFSESEMYSEKKHIKEKMSLLLENSRSYKKNGAFFLKTSSFGDEKDRVIIKENGDFTYFLSDILYHINKIERSDLVINVWGSDHHGYIERIKSSLKILGFENIESKINFVLIQMVSLLTSDGRLKKFSKRLGNTIELREALLLIKKDQLRFSLLEKDSNNHLLINTEILNKESKNSKLYYIQYAYSRCNQIINSWKKDFAKKNFVLKVDQRTKFLLNDQKEKSLVKEISKFEDTLFKSAEQKSPHIILSYIYSLSSDFHSYYQLIPILNSRQEKLTNQRVLLVCAVEKVLSSALKIFSIEPARFMKKVN